MPRNSSGVYSKPAGTTAVAGNLIDPTPWNSLTTDLGNEITNSLPRNGSAPMTAPLQASAGSALLPSLTFNTGATTGFYLKSASEIGIVSSAVEVATIGGYGINLGAFASKSATYTPVLADNNAVHRFTATTTVTFTPAATLGSNWRYTVIADNASVLLDPNGSETINGATTLLLYKGQSAYIVCDGTGFYAVVTQTKDSSPGFINGLITGKTSAYVVSIGAGSAKGNGLFVTNPGAFTKNLNAVWAAGSGNGGRDTAAAITANTTYHLHALINNTTGDPDFLFSLSPTAPTVPSGYSLVTRIDWCYTNATPNAIWDYTQVGNEKFLGVSTWINTTGSIADALYTLPAAIPVPGGIRTAVTILVSTASNTNGSVSTAVNDADAALANYGPVYATSTVGGVVASTANGAGGRCKTNTSRQLRMLFNISGNGGQTQVYASTVEDFTINRNY
ncbi:hypothetical protein [Rhizobium mesoamericanum]|uniref:hypothetical protein n=1 Tax=Rhizobium mesoamericanum TaxID=1079800 RepID=UPI0003FC4261|nr:hypothetical protein [Rhizobium mesoamericanum]